MSSPMPSSLRANGVTGVPLAASMGEGIERGDWFGIKAVPAPACPLCLKPWTCNDAHHICCIPCGHMYGKSCLEWWLQSFGNKSATCPVCHQLFERRHVINLHAPGNLWGGCCNLQESLRAKLQEQAARKAEVDAKVTELTSLLAEKEQKWREQLAQIERKSNELMETAANKIISMKQRIKKIAEEKKAESKKLTKFVQLQEQAARMAEVDTKVTELTSLLAEKEQKWREQLAQIERKSNELMDTATNKIILLEQRIKKIAEEKKAESEKLTKFVQTPLAFAPIRVVKKRRSHGRLLSIHKPSFLPDGAAEKRWEHAGNRLLERISGAKYQHLSITNSLAQSKARVGDGAKYPHLTITNSLPQSKSCVEDGVKYQHLTITNSLPQSKARTGDGAKYQQHLTITNSVPQSKARVADGAKYQHLTITNSLAQSTAHGGDGAGPSHYPARLLYPSPLCS